MKSATPKIQSRLASSRRHARRKALQALYQWELNEQPAIQIEKQFLVTQDMEKADLEYFQALLRGVAEDCPRLDQALLPHLNWKPEQLDPVERQILRIGAYELSSRIDTPVRVVINEAVELAKIFGAEQSHKFINGVLDKLAQIERRVELGGS